MSVRRLAEKQPPSFAFTAENLAWAKAQIAKYPEGRQQSAVIPMLWRAQEQAGGWLPQKAIEARRRAARHGENPRARSRDLLHHVQSRAGRANSTCSSAARRRACCAAPKTLKNVCQRMIGEQIHVTADGKFSWIEVECLGACVNAPMVQINDDYYEDLTPRASTRILDDLAAGKTPKPGPQIDRSSPRRSAGRRR